MGMSIQDAAKFFKENVERSSRSDPINYNASRGMLKLVEELHREIQKLRSEIAHVSQQVGQLRR